MLRAACRGTNPEVFFAQKVKDLRVAKRMCQACPVRYECLAEALDGPVHSGLWGGLSERERRQLLRRYPQVRCWRRVLRATPAPVGSTDPVRPTGPAGPPARTYGRDEVPAQQP
jgi:WhiB family redox-sensing transcriptional regulator